jgi:hypothetical protein
MKFLTTAVLLFIVFGLFSCEAIQKATNSTGSAFTLSGQWQLTSNTPDNVLVGSKVTVAPFVSEGRITTLAATANCLRENDVVWKTIAADNAGGFAISSLVSGCNGLNYQPANIYVINNNEIRVTGKNANGQEATQLWKRVQ